MKVKNAMSRDVKIVNPGQPIRDAARMMAEIDTGVLPVGENDELVGMITDRDIAIRAVAVNKPADTPVREIMSRDVKYCFDTDELSAVADNMSDIRLRRLPVMNRDKRLVGMLSLGDIARTNSGREAGKALSGIAAH